MIDCIIVDHILYIRVNVVGYRRQVSSRRQAFTAAVIQLHSLLRRPLSLVPRALPTAVGPSARPAFCLSVTRKQTVDADDRC